MQNIYRLIYKIYKVYGKNERRLVRWRILDKLGELRHNGVLVAIASVFALSECPVLLRARCRLDSGDIRTVAAPRTADGSVLTRSDCFPYI